MDNPEKQNKVVTSELNENDILELNDAESDTEDNVICNTNQIRNSDTSKDQRRDSIEDIHQPIKSVPSDTNTFDSEAKSANLSRLNALVDSESDEDITSILINKNNIIDSDSDRDIINKTIFNSSLDSENDNNCENTDKLTKKFTKKRKKAKIIDDSSNDDENKEKSKELEFHENDKTKTIYDSDTSSSSDDASSPQDIVPKNLPKRESAKEAMLQMQIIQSESQRMAREANIRVPYHRPKQYSLKQFLSRRTDATLSPSIGIVPQTTAATIKMNQTELIEYAKKIELRESEAKLFFKNDDGEEEEEANIHSDDHNTINLEEISVINNSNEQSTSFTDKIDTVEDATPNDIENEILISKDEDYLDKLVASGRTDLINKEIPRLTGEAFIDLDSDCNVPALVSGAQELFDRFVKQTKIHKPRKTAQLDLLKTVNGIIEHEIITISLNNEETFDRDPIPGAAFFKLQNELRNKIVQKRQEDFLKKYNTMEDEILPEHEAIDYSDCELNDEDDPNLENEQHSDKNSLSAEENEGEIEEYKENHVNDSFCDDEEDDDDADELEEEIVIKKSRILEPLDVSDDDDDELVKTKMDNSLSNIFETQNGLEKQTVAESTDELMGLCSGNFDSTTQINSDKCQQLFDTVQNQSNEMELIDLCSGVFKTQVADNNESPNKISILEKMKNTFDSSDSENDEISKTRINKLKQKRKLGFSDDENDDVDENVDDNDIDDAEEQYVNYDSEENEIILQEIKERQKEAKTFFDKEAELSESEWGSADEDEKDLDKLDIELGDEDEFDQEKLQNQLERIHMRQVLDRDARELKLIQEMFVEDEERDGVGRERKFRWLNANKSAIPGDENNLNTNGENNSDDENEELWRKMRFERESLLKQEADKKLILESTNENIGTNVDGSNIFTVKKKIKVFNRQNYVPKSSLPNSPFLTNNDAASRASFLSRDKATLSRVASLSKNYNDSDGIQLESGKNKKSFVFTALSPSVNDEEKMQSKRKSTDVVFNTEAKKFKNNSSTFSKRLF